MIKVKHIDYVLNDTSVCLRPDLLGCDLVYTMYVDDEVTWCRTCSALLRAHNESALIHDAYNPPTTVKFKNERKGGSDFAEGFFVATFIFVLLSFVAAATLAMLGKVG